MRLLVVGATGLLGSSVCARARAAGWHVRALVRRGSSRGDALGDLGCELTAGDLRDRASIERACLDVDAVVTTANSILSRRAGDTLVSVDRDGALSLVRTAREARVARFVYTSVTAGLLENNAFVRYKREVERAVRSSGMAWTILQPTAFMEIHAGEVGGWRIREGRARVAGAGMTPVGYIAVDDVAAFAVAVLTNESATSRDLPLMGPDAISALDAVRIAERVTGRAFKIQRVPITLLKAARLLVKPFNPQLDAVLGMIVAQEQSPPPLIPSPYAAFGITPTSFEEYVRRA